MNNHLSISHKNFLRIVLHKDLDRSR